MNPDGKAATVGVGGDISTARPAPSADDVLEQVQQDIAAWCISRPDPSALTIAAAYDELAQLDTKERLLLAKNAQRERVLSGLAARRQLLRSRALELSRGRLRPLTPTDLPVEVLRLVFREFEDKDVWDHGPGWEPRVQWASWGDIRQGKARRQALGRLRLVCRLFAEIAAPMLFPILSVHVSQAALDLADAISRNSAMAAGVKGIRVYLDRRPREYAESIARFKDVHLTPVGALESSFRGELELYESGVYSTEHGEEGLMGSREWWELSEGVEACCLLRKEWSEYHDPETHDVPLTKYQEALRKGHAEFRRMSDEQHRLLQDGTYANALAAAVARMPNARSLGFFECLDKPAGRELEDALVTNDYEALSQLITRPLEWGEILAEGEGAIATEDCTLVWELPIALYKAGVSLAQVDLRFCLQYRSFSALNSPDQTPADHPAAAAWDDLAAACQNLESFDMAVTVLASNAPKVTIPDTDSFLGAVLSRCGYHLRLLTIDFTNVARGGYGVVGGYNTGPFLRMLPALPRIRELRITSLALPHAALDAFCSGLGSELAFLVMFDVWLEGGEWADIVDTLRGKMATARSRGAVECVFSGLLGGEFMAVVEPAVLGDAVVDEYVENGGKIHEQLVDAVEEYVQGLLDENPLRNGGR